jgi:hypothetical protein
MLVGLMAMLMVVLLAAAFLLGRHVRKHQLAGEQLSPVSRQHIDLFQGGQLNEVLVEAAKTRFRELLERGEVAAVEASLRPGTQYVVQVRALAELGTEAAGRILERQLQRRLSDDKLEQAWYWIDLASSLRSLNRQESLPHLLRCAEAAGEVPLCHFFAAETICFLGFSGYLQQLDTPLGTAALRVLHRALEGLRFGVPPLLVAESRLGEMIELLWDHRSEHGHPLFVLVLMETLRLIRRAPNSRTLLGERSEQESFDWQMSRLAVLEPILADYLHEAAVPLLAALPAAEPAAVRDLLAALSALRAETSSGVLPLLARPGCPYAEQAVDTLTWSRDPRTGPWLRAWVQRRVPVRRRRRTALAFLRRRCDVPGDVPYRSILRALRGHPGTETDKLLLVAAQDRDAGIRAAAISSFGWWEPSLRAEVLLRLSQARRDPHPEVRQAARAALARLGERQSLQWFRQALTAEEPQHLHEAVQVVADEGLTLLWPDLDRLVDSDNPEVAHHAREALERLSEDLACNS